MGRLTSRDKDECAKERCPVNPLSGCPLPNHEHEVSNGTSIEDFAERLE